MITAYAISDERLRPLPDVGDLAPALWIDLFNPSIDEEREVEALQGVDLPTREDMEEIEHSSRLYVQDGTAYMTGTIPAKADGDDPDMQPVTFVLTADRLITIRYHEPSAFRTIAGRAAKGTVHVSGSEGLLLAILEAVIDREADILERAGREIEAISRSVFRQPGVPRAGGRDFQKTLEEIGRKGDLLSKIRDSLASLDRLAAFLAQIAATRGADKTFREQVKTLSRDIQSISDHAGFLGQKTTFLLDATLGMISIEQNATIKIFSVVAVVFLPPTLIASIYGMNFEFMPELGWRAGYPLAFLLMIVSAILPYLYFKRRGWL